VFSRNPERVTLPEAARAMLPAPDGSRYGLTGRPSLGDPGARPELAAAASGGLSAVLLSATRAAATVFGDADREDRG
jgi:hypothetical protein